MKVIYRFSRFTYGLFLRLVYRMKVYGLENVIEGPCLIAATHTSHLDPPIIGCAWPKEVHFLARHTLFKRPFFSRWLKQLNAHPITRGEADLSSFKVIHSLLSQGQQVVMFPEGERSSSGNIQPLKEGTASISLRSGCPIIPAYIHGSFEAWGRHRKRPRLFGRIAVVFGKPIFTQDYLALERHLARRLLTQKLEEELHTLKAWYEKR